MKQSYKFGLIGHRIGYSRSPAIFDAIFNHLGVDGSFENFDLSEPELEAAFDNKTFAEISGLSVTIPYKKTVINLLNNVDPIAETLEAVNSISLREEGTFGSNTDWIGFANPLAEYNQQLDGRSAIIFGYGGSAKAVIYSLYKNFNVKAVSVIGRDLTRAKENLTQLQNHLDGLEIQYTAQLANRLREAIMVNCTPLGGFNYADQVVLPTDLALDQATIYYDLNYNPDNQTIARLRKQGRTAIDGSAMLVAQALESFRLWTQREVPFDPIYKAVFLDK